MPGGPSTIRRVVAVALVLLVSVAAALPPPAKPSAAALRAQQAKAGKVLQEIQKECGIADSAGQFRYDADGISLIYDGMIEATKLNCASDRATLRGVGFETYDTSAAYSGPRRFIVKGPSKRLDAVAVEVVAAHWTITHRADAAGGIGFLEMETPEKGTRKEVQDFLDRFHGDFRDVPIGIAPMTRLGYDLPTTATYFRAIARGMYRDLTLPSCGAPPGLDREAQLRPDRDAVLALERELPASPASVHLAIANEDAAKQNSGCWADDDMAFAKIHVGMVHRSVSFSVVQLRRLAPAVEPLLVGAAPANAVEFRDQVWQMTQWTLPHCSYTSKGDNRAVFAAARKRIGLFEDRLKGTPYAVQYAVAKEDASYDQSQHVAECDDPGRDPVAKLSAEMLGYADKRIALLDKLTRVAK